MNRREVMTAEELHELGIDIVSKEMKRDGYEILNVNNTLGMNPQITASKGGQLAFVAVRTASYPEKGRLEDTTHFQMIEHADEFDAIPFFASVVISNADANTEEEKWMPVSGGSLHAACEGLLIICCSDRLQMWNGDTARNAAVAGLR